MNRPLMPFGMIYRNRGEVPPNAGKGTESDYDYEHAHAHEKKAYLLNTVQLELLGRLVVCGKVRGFCANLIKRSCTHYSVCS
jgi:hypothetical protein